MCNSFQIKNIGENMCLCPLCVMVVENKKHREIIFHKKNSPRPVLVTELLDGVLPSLDSFLFVKSVKVLSESFRGKAFIIQKPSFIQNPDLALAPWRALSWGLLPLFCSALGERGWSQGRWKFLTLMPRRTSLATFRTMQIKWPNYSFFPNWNDFFTRSGYIWYELAKRRCNPLEDSCSWAH